jgi:hypothetical protein
MRISLQSRRMASGAGLERGSPARREMVWPWLVGFGVLCVLSLAIVVCVYPESSLAHATPTIFDEDEPVESAGLVLELLSGIGFIVVAMRGAGRGWAVLGGLCLIGAGDDFGWGTRQFHLPQPWVLGEQVDGVHDIIPIAKHVYVYYLSREARTPTLIALALVVGVAGALAVTWLVRHRARAAAWWAGARHNASVWLAVMAVGLDGLAQTFDSGLFYTAYFRQEPLPPLAAWVRSLPSIEVEESMELLGGLGLTLAAGLLLWRTRRKPDES